MANNQAKDKGPKTFEVPSPTKKASNVEDPHAYKGQFPAWRFKHIDEGGEWAITEEVLPDIIKNRLKVFETTKWSEIEAQLTSDGKHKKKSKRHKKHHSQDVTSLSKEAQDRWKKRKINYDTVFRFRFGGTLRLWGVRENNVFKPVWWDIDHTVYPTEPN
jgi:hypothetical protein